MSLLAVDSPALSFGRGDEDKLRAELVRFDLAAEVLPVGEAADVELRPDGTLGRLQAKPTAWCLYQLCRAACPGLYRAMIELTADGNESARLAAISIINQAVRLRFVPFLHGRRLLIDRMHKTVEALVGDQYHFIPNLRIYDQIADAMQAVGRPVRFYEGWLRGRWMLVRHYEIEPLLTTSFDRLNYHAGWHFSNHEGGQSSLRGANMLVRGKERLAMMMPFRGRQKLRHLVSTVRRIGNLLATVAQRVMPADVLEAGLKRLSESRLGLGLLQDDAEQARRKSLARRLALSGVPATAAARVVAGMLLQGYNESEPLPACSISREILSGRTGLDLAVAASREAKSRDIALREGLEQLAYRLLLGTTKTG